MDDMGRQAGHPRSARDPRLARDPRSARDPRRRQRHNYTGETYVYVPKHMDRYLYDIGGHIFELTAKYQPRTFIGRSGGYPVCVAKDRDTNKDMAIMKISNTMGDYNRAKKTLLRIMLLPRINHKNVPKFADIVPPPRRELFKDEIYLVYNKMPYNLHDAIYSDMELSVKDVLYQILCGLKYIHSGSCRVHNLNLNSVKLNRIDNNNWEVEIGGFEMGSVDPQTNLFTKYVEPTRYEAPELLVESQSRNRAMDIWSAGCIFMELLTRQPLFPGENAPQNLYFILNLLGIPSDEDLWFLTDRGKNLVKNPPFCVTQQPLHAKFPNVDSLALDLASKMIHFNPSKRITAANALAHPYLDSSLGPEPVGTPFSTRVELLPFEYENLKDLIFHQMTFYDT